MPDALNVTASKPGGSTGGAIRRAPLGTTLPTDANSTLAVAFVSVGYISEDGFKETKNNESSNQKDWGGHIVLNNQISSERKFTFKMLERFNEEVQKVVNGDANVTTASAGGYKTMTIVDDGAEQTAHVWVIDEIGKTRNGEAVLTRTVIPAGTVTSISEITHKAGEAVAYEVEITAEYSTAISAYSKTYTYMKE